MPDLLFNAPRILVLADAGPQAGAAVRAAEALGARVGEPIALEQAEALLDRQRGFDAIMLELTADHGALTQRLLARVRQLSANDRIPTLVCCPFDLIDRVEGSLADSPATLLVDADEADRIAALILAGQDHALAAGQRVREIDPVRLRRLADEVGRIASALSSLSAQAPGYPRKFDAQFGEGTSGFGAEPPDLIATSLPPSEVVRKVIRMRRLRDSYFDPALFADPAWDMLLDLLAARIEGDRVAVSSLCIAAAVPPTTALRWIKAMTEDGLVERHADPDDGRRVYVRLSPAATIALSRYFQAVERFEGVAI